MKTQERELARRLRSEDGASVKEIARRVGVSVSSVAERGRNRSAQHIFGAIQEYAGFRRDAWLE
jgi:transcriptional regulator with XRE-family HTH domain